MSYRKMPSSVSYMNRTAGDIILRPVITEKSMEQHVYNKYTFYVDLKANKVEIRNAVEELFKVHVTNVTTVRVMGKTRRRGRVYGKCPDFKKAYVTIKEGEKIEIAGAPLYEQ